MATSQESVRADETREKESAGRGTEERENELAGERDESRRGPEETTAVPPMKTEFPACSNPCLLATETLITEN